MIDGRRGGEEERMTRTKAESKDHEATDPLFDSLCTRAFAFYS